jgi:hypothetical protein
MHGNSSVSQSYSTAAISGDGNVAYIGGLAGNCSMASLIEDSYYAGTITHAGSAKGIGGIAGQNGSFGSVIRSCYAAGTIAADSNSPVGGIAGENFSAQGNDITRCAALQSAITNAANKASRPRRIAGTLGDLAALTNNIANAAMTLPEASAALDAGPDGLDGAECDAKPGRQVFAETLGWDFAAVWAMGAEGYPVLQWQLAL